MLCKKFLVLLLLILPVAQCSDFKDVFNSGDNTTSPKSHASTKSRQKNQPAEQNVNEVVVDPNARGPISTREGTYYFIAAGDTLTSIATKYKVSGIALAHVNDMLYESTLDVGRRIFIPNKKKLSKYVDRKMLKNSMAKMDGSEKGKTPPSNSAKSKSVGFIWPTDKGVMTSGFGMRHGRHHDGIDIGVPSGTPVFAVADGEILFAEYFSAYGNLILIKHKNGLFTAYAHNRKFLVSKGQKVKQGQTIAESGKTGRATGPHVHFEVHKKGGVKIDPLTVLPPRPSK